MGEIIPIILRDLEGFISDAVIEVLRGKRQVRNSRKVMGEKGQTGRKGKQKTVEMGRVKKKEMKG